MIAASSWIGSEANYISVGIFDVHFQCPWKIGRRHEDLYSERFVLFKQFLDIPDTDPDPSFALALTALTKINSSPVSVHAGEFAGAPNSVFETEQFT
jgi:hypothetical protein